VIYPKTVPCIEFYFFVVQGWVRFFTGIALSLICFKLKEHNLIFKLALHISYAYVINFYANFNVKN
jgi:hypothetical protein